MSHMDNEINPRTLSPRLLGAGRRGRRPLRMVINCGTLSPRLLGAGRQHLVPRCALQGRRPQRMVINKMVFIGSL